MRALTVPELLSVWERGLGACPFERALALLSAASPESSAASVTRVSIGCRDARLLRLREWAFGSELLIVAACPRCHGSIETTLAVADLRTPAETTDGAESSSLTMGDYRILFRAPNSEDLRACVGLDLAASRRTLLARSVLDARRGGETISAGELPGAVIESLIKRIAEIDRAEIGIALICPDCQYRWNELFDIVSFFWTEIDAWARRLLREVHVLASAYGWSERDILSLSPTRRQIYLALAEA